MTKIKLVLTIDTEFTEEEARERLRALAEDLARQSIAARISEETEPVEVVE